MIGQKSLGPMYVTLVDDVDPPSPLGTIANPVVTGGGGAPAALGQATMAASVPVVIASDQSPVAATIATANATSTVTGVAQNAASVVLIAANVNRHGLTIVNGPSGNLYVKENASPAAIAAAGYNVKISPNGYYEVPFGYTGEVRGIWSAAGAGWANMDEVTA